MQARAEAVRGPTRHYSGPQRPAVQNIIAVLPIQPMREVRRGQRNKCSAKQISKECPSYWTTPPARAALSARIQSVDQSASAWYVQETDLLWMQLARSVVAGWYRHVLAIPLNPMHRPRKLSCSVKTCRPFLLLGRPCLPFLQCDPPSNTGVHPSHLHRMTCVTSASNHAAHLHGIVEPGPVLDAHRLSSLAYDVLREAVQEPEMRRPSDQYGCMRKKEHRVGSL